MATVALLAGVTPTQAFPNAPASRLRNVRLLVAVTAGAAGYFDATTGKAGLCNTNSAGKQQFRGIFMRAGAIGDVVAFLTDGDIAGFDLSGLAFEAIVFAQDTDGLIGDAAGTKNVPIGRVVGLPDGFGTTLTKYLRIQQTVLTNY